MAKARQGEVCYVEFCEIFILVGRKLTSWSGISIDVQKDTINPLYSYLQNSTYSIDVEKNIF
jgi:hypothetical protein